MYGDYGYMEEGELGKPYNFKLLRKLAVYAFPYKKTIAFALLLTILITLFNLAIPYLSKIAIDHHILSSWYLVDYGSSYNDHIPNIQKKYGQLLQNSKDKSFATITYLNKKKIDPSDLHFYQRKGIISSERFYLASPEIFKNDSSIKNRVAFREMDDGSILIPYEMVAALPEEHILKIRSSDFMGVARIGMLLLILLFISFGLSYAEHYLLEFAGQHIMQDIRLKLFSRIQSQSLKFFDHQPVGRLVTRVTNDIENLNEMFKSVLITVFKDVFILTGILAILLYLNWRLALVCFILLPFIFGFTFLFSSRAREAFREIRAKIAKINAFLQERLTGMRVIQLFATEKIQMAQFANINHENYIAGMKQIRVFAVFMPVMELFSSVAVGLLIWYGGGKVIGDQMTLGSLVAFIGYMQMFFKPIRDISEKYNIMQSAMASTERIFEFMEYNETVPKPEHPVVPKEIKGHLVFENVSFSYQKGRPVLKDISFEVNPGEMVAIVGHTGSGKTTLVNLVERFFDPDSGKILLDGIDLRAMSRKSLRESISLVMQDVFIFSGNLEDNISLGKVDIDVQMIENSAKLANAHEFIQRLSGGYRHTIGEGGSTLSGGERQLLSFSRALANNPRILILDEATSSVDPETERLIQQAISRMVQERTTLVVAHRLSTIRNADRILVLHHGRIREQGTHGELIKMGGIYYKLSKLRESNAHAQ